MDDKKELVHHFVQGALNRGSCWRKWDLHLHGPFAVFNNQFGDPGSQETWDKYFEAIEKLSDFAVLGITDYFSIDTYKRVREAKQQGRLKNIHLVLPNIELRLKLIIPTKADGASAKSRKINAHVIFSDEVSPEDIEQNFLSQLNFTAVGNAQGISETRAITRYQLEQFGARLKREHPSFSGSDYHVGCLNASVDFEDVKRVLNERQTLFGDRNLVFVASENLSLISWDGAGHQLRKSLVQGCDGFFGNSSDREWLLGRRHPAPTDFVAEFGGLKPCIQGSDAHELSKIGEPVDGKFCWVKADPSFEGLRQITFEPSERVMLVDAIPVFKHPFRIIDSVEVKGAPDWFSYSSIPLNSDLVSVIGGKGAGKSALAELISYAGGSDVFRGKRAKELQDTFLSKASKRTSANLRPVTGATISLRWVDGATDSVSVNEDLNHRLPEEKVKYLPQKFVEEICAPENHQQLLREMERVVFQRIPRTDRLGMSTFLDLRDFRNKNISVKKSHLADEIAAINREVYSAFERVNSRPQKSKLLGDARKTLASLLKDKPDTSEISKDDLDRLAAIQGQWQSLQEQVAGLQAKLSTIDEIEARYTTLGSRLKSFNAEVTTLLETLGLGDRLSDFNVALPGGYNSILDEKRLEFSAAISNLRDGSTDGATISTLEQEANSLRDSLNLSQTKRATFEKFEKDKAGLEEQISSLEMEIKTIDSALTVELNKQREARLEKFLDYFEILKEEKSSLDSLYKPLKDTLSTEGAGPRKFDFRSRISFDFDSHTDLGVSLLDGRRGRFADAELLQSRLKRLLAEMDAVGFERDFVREKLLKFKEEFLRDGNDQPIELGSQLRRNRTEEDFNNWFYSLDPYSVEYSITFEGRDLSLLSPGQKGIVLLMVYLDVDRDDQRPLVIDQPEDNLDNLSVYANLIEFFRKRKLYRQIILITHNPNLVVNTDSEQIVIANYDGERNPKIAYRSGSLEDSSADPPGIREEVCAVLEGGADAFKRRELKYSLD
jgi:hypothetical protein